MLCTQILAPPEGVWSHCSKTLGDVRFGQKRKRSKKTKFSQKLSFSQSFCLVNSFFLSNFWQTMSFMTIGGTNILCVMGRTKPEPLRECSCIYIDDIEWRVGPLNGWLQQSLKSIENPGYPLPGRQTSCRKEPF